MDAFVYALGSVLIISFVSLIGMFTLSFRVDQLKKVLLYLVSLSAGALFGDAFLHLLPEIVEEHGFVLPVSLSLLGGISFSFVIEKFIHWRHCHMPTSKDHPHPLAIMNLVGDGIHNFIDGLIIGVSYLVSVPVGIATTIAVFMHEIPQEIGDFGVLLYSGLTRKKALFLNFLLALTSVLGVLVVFVISNFEFHITLYLLPFAAGTFIYIAGSDLIPEIHKTNGTKNSFLQLISFLLGITLMLLLVLLE